MAQRFAILTVFLISSSVACFSQSRVNKTNPCEESNVSIEQARDSRNRIDPNTADLPSVILIVEQALVCYQSLANGDDDPTRPKGLPQLETAEFDFKTITSMTKGFNVSFFVVSVGSSKEKDATNDITFTYGVPTSVSKEKPFAKPAPPDLFKELVSDVEAAAVIAQTQRCALGKPLSKVSISIGYGIKISATGSGGYALSLVTVSGSGGFSKNNTQTMKLTFQYQLSEMAKCTWKNR